MLAVGLLKADLCHVLTPVDSTMKPNLVVVRLICLYIYSRDRAYPRPLQSKDRANPRPHAACGLLWRTRVITMAIVCINEFAPGEACCHKLWTTSNKLFQLNTKSSHRQREPTRTGRSKFQRGKTNKIPRPRGATTPKRVHYLCSFNIVVKKANDRFGGKNFVLVTR